MLVKCVSDPAFLSLHKKCREEKSGKLSLVFWRWRLYFRMKYGMVVSKK